MQGMKLLPTGRKSTMYIVLYGSMVRGLSSTVYDSLVVVTFILCFGLTKDDVKTEHAFT